MCLVGYSVSFGGLIVTLENDTFLDKDDNYSHGTEIEYVDKLYRDEFSVRRVGYGVNQLMYTPHDISNTEFPPQNDRPWSGTLSLYRESWRLYKTQSIRTRVSIGVLGPSAKAQRSQRTIHTWLGCAMPEGWSHQMPDEPMVNVYQDRYHKLLSRNVSGKWEGRIYSLYGGTLGTAFVNGRLGGEAQFGYNIPDGSLPGGIVIKGYHGGRIRKLASEFFIYVTAGAHGELVLHNATIGNSMFRSREVGQERSLEPLTYETKYGIVTGVKNFSFSYLFFERGDEFRGQSLGRMKYGVVRFEFTQQF